MGGISLGGQGGHKEGAMEGMHLTPPPCNLHTNVVTVPPPNGRGDCHKMTVPPPGGGGGGGGELPHKMYHGITV